jgi:hypothetical protein
MQANPILLTLVAMAAIVFTVAGVMFRRRVAFMKANRLHPQKVATSAKMAAAIEDTRASDNFRNLFEMPVLFYAAVLTATVTNMTSIVLLVLAWGYVLARALHSAIHCTHNTVMQRFYAFLTSTLLLLAMWIVIAFHLITASIK